MDPNQSEYAARWLVCYYNLERIGIDRVYHYHTSIVTLTDILVPPGIVGKLENFHRGKIYILSITPLQGFRWEPFTGKNVYVDFKAIAKKCQMSAAVELAQRVNTKFMDDVKNVLSDHGEGLDLSMIKEIERVTTAIIERTAKTTNFTAKLEQNLQRVWEKNLLPKIHGRYFSKTASV